MTPGSGCWGFQSSPGSFSRERAPTPPIGLGSQISPVLMVGQITGTSGHRRHLPGSFWRTAYILELLAETACWRVSLFLGVFVLKHVSSWQFPPPLWQELF